MNPIIDWLQSIGGLTQDRTEEPETVDDSEPQSTLFCCPECETVYISVRDDVCSICGASVEPIPSTPTEV